MGNYDKIKTKAKEFANERHAPVYIVKAFGINHYKIVFKRGQISERNMRNYIETVYPDGEDPNDEAEKFKRRVWSAKVIVGDPRNEGVAKFDDDELNEELRFRKAVYLDAVDFLKSIGEL